MRKLLALSQSFIGELMIYLNVETVPGTDISVAARSSHELSARLQIPIGFRHNGFFFLAYPLSSTKIEDAVIQICMDYDTMTAV